MMTITKANVRYTLLVLAKSCRLPYWRQVRKAREIGRHCRVMIHAKAGLPANCMLRTK